MNSAIRCKMLAVALLMLPAVAAAQTTPGGPATAPLSRGKVMDISGYPDLAALPVRRMSVDFDHLAPALAARAMSVDSVVEVTAYAGAISKDPMTLHLKEVPFMQFAMAFCEQAHCKLVEATPEKVTFGSNPREEVPPWCVAGPFVVQLFGITHEIINRSGPMPSANPAMLHMDLAAEPGLTMASYMQDVQCPDLQDEKGQAIGLAPDSIGSNRQHPVNIRMALPTSPGRRIPVFKGTVDVTVAKVQHVELANVTEAHTVAAGGMNLEIAPLVAENGPFHRLAVTYSRGTMAPDLWRQVKVGFATAKIELKVSGNRMADTSLPASMGGGGIPGENNADRVQLSYMVIFTDNGPTGAATIEVPVEAKTLRVPFEFRDVVLP